MIIYADEVGLSRLS